MATVNLENVVKKYDDTQVVHSINLQIKDGEFLVLLGPSGCGKSTTLRMVAGLEEISGGTISIGEKIVNNIVAKDRGVAMVFQSYALYPHKTVRQNMEFGLKLSKTPRDEINRKVQETADILELGALLDRKPGALSGGQRQRVAMGRAMVRTPEVFLFDEPLSNLDAKLRAHMRLELQKLHQKLATTTIYVTHDQIEAMTLADRIVIMKDGHIEQIGTPQEVYYQPKSIFVASFIGTPAMNMLDMVVSKTAKETWLETAKIRIPLNADYAKKLENGQQMVVGIRPNECFISTDNKQSKGKNLLGTATIEIAELLGANALVGVVLDGKELFVEVSSKNIPARGSKISVSFNPEALHIFDKASGNSVV
ncbi:MAG: sn-glycerol-3-phosphate ABC transporter ATP-binding protein UgpC [Alphaproteobacteria bacterium]|nr:sn-glycerol-3-phosphate ABC transporter ATP-binding protein UgpC [Alphaproteobacteria bacterium]